MASRAQRNASIFNQLGDIDDTVDDVTKIAIHPEDVQYTLSDTITTGFSALHHTAKAEDFVGGTEGIIDGSVPFTGDISMPSLNITTDIVLGGLVDGRDISADGAKLDGIEEGAGGNANTGPEIVALIAAEPGNHLVDDTQLADINSIDQIYTLAEKTLVVSSVPFVVADKAKLDAIEAGATADQNGAEIGAVLFAESNINNFDDAHQAKLDAMDPGASDDQTGAEIKALYEAESDTNVFSDSDLNKLTNIEANATGDQDGAEIAIAIAAQADANLLSDAQLAKVNSVESGATADQTGAQIKALYEAQADTNAYTDFDKQQVGLNLAHIVEDTTPELGGHLNCAQWNVTDIKDLTGSGAVDFSTSTKQINLGVPTRVVQGFNDIQITTIAGTNTTVIDGPKEMFGDTTIHNDCDIEDMGLSRGLTLSGDSSNLMAIDFRHLIENTLCRIEIDRANGREFRIQPPDVSGGGVISLLKHTSLGKTIMGNADGETFRLVNNSFHVGYTADSDFTTLLNGGDTGLSIRDDGVIHSGTANSSGHAFNYSGANSSAAVTRWFRGGTDVGSVDVTASATTYNTTSDGRLKDVTGPIGNGVEVIKDLEPVEFTWKSDEDQTPDFGFIAQQVNETGASYAISDSDPDHLKMDYGRITPHIVAALKTALDRIDQLEQKIKELE